MTTPRRTRTTAALSGLAALAMALSACGGKADADAQPTGIQQSDIERIAAAASHQASANASDGSSSPASASSSPADYTIPEAAKAHTKEGALAFVKFYWETLDRLDAHPQDDVLSNFASAQCSACALQEKAIAKSAAEQSHIEGSHTMLRNIREASTSTLAEPVFLFRQTESRATRVTASGERRPLKEMSFDAAVRLQWHLDHWQVAMYGADGA